MGLTKKQTFQGQFNWKSQPLLTPKVSWDFPIRIHSIHVVHVVIAFSAGLKINTRSAVWSAGCGGTQDRTGLVNLSEWHTHSTAASVSNRCNDQLWSHCPLVDALGYGCSETRGGLAVWKVLVFPLMYSSFLLCCFSFQADHGSFLFASLTGTSILGGSKIPDYIHWC